MTTVLTDKYLENAFHMREMSAIKALVAANKKGIAHNGISTRIGIFYCGDADKPREGGLTQDIAGKYRTRLDIMTLKKRDQRKAGKWRVCSNS